MSGTSSETPLSGYASQIEERAAALLMERHGEKGWSKANQKELDDWLAESPINLVTFWRLEAALDRTHRLHALQPSAFSSRRAFWPGLYRVAAGFGVAVILAAVVAAYFIYPAESVYTTPIGGHETITLADGSRVELNTDTILRARISLYRRDISLDKGEAYFQVKHDVKRPFVVAVSGHRLTDLGTKFLVRSAPNRFEVAVLEGRVQFESRDGRLRQPVLLGAGEIVTGVNNEVYVAKEPHDDLAAKLGWQHGVLIFNHTALGDAATEFNRYNRDHIVVADQAAAHRLIGGTFPVDDVGAFTRLAHEVLRLHVENRGTETVISR